MLLAKKTAIIYGGGGRIGGAVARAWAAEGATVHLVGRTPASLDAVAADIRAAGGAVEVAAFDAADPAAVDAHARSVDGIDVSFNLISRGDRQGTPLVEMEPDAFMGAVEVGLRSTFLTARAAARSMARRGSGVILSLTSGSARGMAPMMGNTGPADAAIESFMRYLAVETGPSGIRVVGIHTAGVVGAVSTDAIRQVDPNGPDADALEAMIAQFTLLRRAPKIIEVVNMATFLASDLASGITNALIPVNCGMPTT